MGNIVNKVINSKTVKWTLGCLTWLAALYAIEYVTTSSQIIRERELKGREEAYWFANRLEGHYTSLPIISRIGYLGVEIAIKDYQHKNGVDGILYKVSQLK